MEFGIEKCVGLIIKRGKVTQSEGMMLSDDSNITSLEEGEGYNTSTYVGVLESNEILHSQMKEKIRKEYLRHVRKVAQTKIEWKTFDTGHKYMGGVTC